MIRPNRKPSLLKFGVGGGASVEPDWPFKGYVSPFTGVGEPPSNQNLKFRIRPGHVNNIIPSNITEEFLADASATTWVWVDVTLTDGVVSAVSINKGSTVPSSSATHVYWAIFLVRANATAITEFDAPIKTSLSVTRVVFDFNCGENTYFYQVAGA